MIAVKEGRDRVLLFSLLWARGRHLLWSQPGRGWVKRWSLCVSISLPIGLGSRLLLGGALVYLRGSTECIVEVQVFNDAFRVD